MAIIRYRNGMGSFFDELEDLMSSSFNLVGREVGREYPGIDIMETENHYKIFADLPGMTKNDIDINVEQDVLTVRGTKKPPVEKKEKDRFYHFERKYGEFERSFNLPSNVDSNSIEAHYTDGVLEIAIKKMDEVKPKSIEIKVE